MGEGSKGLSFSLEAMKISFIATVFNEEKQIEQFLKSIAVQTKTPDEIIIVDGRSTDATAPIISNFQSLISNKKVMFKFITKKGNRSVGRNEAIKRASGDIILCSDAGCILDKNWVKHILEPFKDKGVDVVAGYYKGIGKTLFQKCLIPYVLVMEDRVNPNTFLPATRSVAFKKSIWKKAGMFNERLSHNEDYEFARRLRKIGAHIVFKKNAIVSWIPRQNLLAAFNMFFRFAYGDAEAGIIRPKVLLLFVRFLIVFLLLAHYIVFKQYVMFNTLCVMLGIYSIWSVIKNYRYVNQLGAFILLPILQITSDIAVILGSVFGLVKILPR